MQSLGLYAQPLCHSCHYEPWTLILFTNSWTKHTSSGSTPRYDSFTHLQHPRTPFQSPSSVAEELESKRTLSRRSRFQMTGGKINIFGVNSSAATSNHRKLQGPQLQSRVSNRWYRRAILSCLELMRTHLRGPILHHPCQQSFPCPKPPPSVPPARSLHQATWISERTKGLRPCLPWSHPIHRTSSPRLGPMGRLWVSWVPVSSMRVLWGLISAVMTRGCKGSSRALSVGGDAYIVTFVHC